MLLVLAVCTAVFGAAAAAAPLDVALPPTAELLREQNRGLASMQLPIGPCAG